MPIYQPILPYVVYMLATAVQICPIGLRLFNVSITHPLTEHWQVDFSNVKYPSQYVSWSHFKTQKKSVGPVLRLLSKFCLYIYLIIYKITIVLYWIF